MWTVGPPETHRSRVLSPLLGGSASRRLSEEIGKLRVELSGEMGKLRAEMHDLRANLIQWMFLFWIGQIGVLTGILFAFFRK